MGVAVFHVLLGYALIAGLTVRMPLRLAHELKIFNITPPPPHRCQVSFSFYFPSAVPPPSTAPAAAAAAFSKP